MQKELAKTKETGKYPLKAQIQEIIAVIAAFSTLLLRETEALKKADFKTVDALQADKKLFARQYQAKIEVLAARRDELPGLDLALREKLVRERGRFSVVLNDNMHALDRSQNSVKRLVNNILDAARHAVLEDQQTNYSRSGKAMTYKSASTSLATDQRL
jgi:hypothetical protein